MASYIKSSGLNDATIGKISTPIKMVIEHESDLLERQGGTCSRLFNIEKSNHFGETIVIQKEFDIFRAVAEGNAATSDFISDMSRKFIEHIQFMKEFSISAEMIEDANFGIAADAKRRAQNFTRAYYKTKNKICEYALANATTYKGSFGGATIDLTSNDGAPLFSSEHIWGDAVDQKQCNYYTTDLIYSGSDRAYTPEKFAPALFKLSCLLRNMKDENGEPIGYTADTIILPGNKPMLESVVKAVCGSESITGSANNDINLHFGNWNIVVMPSWQATDTRFIIMSSEANRNLSGNMFFNRVPLTISNWIDHHTGNHIWSGRCRFGVGFGSYKHVIMAVDAEMPVVNSTHIV